MVHKPGKRSHLPSISAPPQVISPDSFPIQEFPPHKGGHACSLADEARRVQAGTGAFVSGALGAALAASLLAAPLLLAPGEAWGQFCLGATTASDSDVTCSAATYPVSIRSTIQSNADVTVRVPGGTGTGGTATVITGSTFYAGINLLASDQYQTGDYAIYVGTSAAVSIVDDPGSGNESPGIRIRHLGSGTATVDVRSQVTIGTSTSSRMRAHGIYVRSSGSGGAATITNAGTIYASYEGIDVQHDGAAATTVTHSGTIDSLNHGIQAVTDGAGALMVTSSGGITVTNANQQGIRMRAQKNGAMTLTATGGTITTPAQGIYMESQGTGAVIIQGTTANTGPTITSSASHGIHVRKTGTSATAGDVSITTTGGTITPGTGNSYGIYVQDQAAYSGSVTIDNAADITAGQWPIFVSRLGSGAVSVTNSGGTVLSRNRNAVLAQNAASDASTVIVSIMGGTMQTEGTGVPAIHAGNRGTGDVSVDIADGAKAISWNHAGIVAQLGDYDAQMTVTQAGAILGRKGVYAQAVQHSTDDPVVARQTADQPVIDIDWTGTFAAGSMTQTAPNDNDRFSVTSAVNAPVFARTAEASAATSGLYDGAAGIEAQVMSWFTVVDQVAQGDDPGAIDATAQNTAVPTGATATNNDYVAQFRAVFGNQELAIAEAVFTAIDSTATSLAGLTDAEIVTYLRGNNNAVRGLLRNLLRQTLSAKEQAVLAALATGDSTGLTAALDDTEAGFSNAYKTAVRALLNRYNVGNIRVAMTAGSIDSRGDGIRAYYATPNANNGAIDVTVAQGAEVTGARTGVWVANAGMGEGNIRKQTVTVNGMVTGGTAGVHLIGGGTVTVGATGRINATSGDGILSDGGDLSVSVAGMVDGDIRATGGALTFASMAGSQVTGTVHDPVGPLTVAGNIGRLLYTAGGAVTVASGGRLTGVTGQTAAIQSSAGALDVTVNSGGTVTGNILAAAGGLTADISGTVNGDIQATGGGDLTAEISGLVDGDVVGSGGGEHEVTVPVGGRVTGNILAAAGDLTADISGTVNGDIQATGGGDLTAEISGLVDGDVVGSGGGEHEVTVPVGGRVTGNILAAAGDLTADISGTVNGDIQATGGGDLTAEISGLVDGDVVGSGGGEHEVTVPVGGRVTGTVHLDGSTVRVDGTVWRIILENRGMVTVGQGGTIGDRENPGDYGVRIVGKAEIVNRGTIRGNIAVDVPGGSTVRNLGGKIISTDLSDAGRAIRFGPGENSMLVATVTTGISGIIEMPSGTVDFSAACPDNLNYSFTRDSTRDRRGPKGPTHGDCRQSGKDEEEDEEDEENRRQQDQERTPNYSAFALTDDMLSDLTGSIHGAVVETEMRLGTTSAGQVVWATPFGGARDQKGKGAPGVMDATHAFGGGLVGTSWGARDVRVGGFIGGSVGQIDTQSNVNLQEQTMDMQTIFGGLYVLHARGTVIYDARMLVGQMTHDLTRHVVGDTAEVEYSSLLLSPEVGVATTLHVTDTLDVRPRLRLRYAGLFTQGFREIADNWDVQYEKRTMHLVEGRAEVGVPVTLANGGQINPRVGVEGRWLLSGSKIKARSLDYNIPHDGDAGGDDGVLTGTLGVGMSVPVADAMALVGSFDGALTTEDAWRATGYLGLTYSF